MDTLEEKYTAVLHEQLIFMTTSLDRLSGLKPQVGKFYQLSSLDLVSKQSITYH